MYDVIPRAEALRRGLKFYAELRACRNGHLSPRYSSNGNCVACAKAAKVKPEIKPNGLTKSELVK